MQAETEAAESSDKTGFGMNFKLVAFADEADGRICEQIKAMTENGIGYLEVRGVDGENISDITKKSCALIT